ncbi:MAG: potassium channel family protein [Candidatus Kapaibacteriota bacterium]|jgi:voltage-gated potassium channel
MSKYRSLRQWTYAMLDERSPAISALLVRWTLITVIVASVAVVIVGSIPEIRQSYGSWLVRIDLLVVVVFVAEYLLRLWSCVEDPRYDHPVLGRLRYVTTPMAVIDVLAILPSVVPFFGYSLRTLRLARLLRLTRLLKLSRYVQALQMIREVVVAKRHPLVSSVFFISFLLVLSSALMYDAESVAQPDKFHSIPATMWWSAMTITTVGYGDVYPVTTFGKVLGALTAVLGLGLFAIPTGILVSGFAELVWKKPPTDADHPRCPHCGR